MATTESRALDKPRGAVDAARKQVAEAESWLVQARLASAQASHKAWQADLASAPSLEAEAVRAASAAEYAEARLALRKQGLAEAEAKLGVATERAASPQEVSAVLASIHAADRRLELAVQSVLDCYSACARARVQATAALGKKHPEIRGFAVRNMLITDASTRLKRWLGQRLYGDRDPAPAP